MENSWIFSMPKEAWVRKLLSDGVWIRIAQHWHHASEHTDGAQLVDSVAAVLEKEQCHKPAKSLPRSKRAKR